MAEYRAVLECTASLTDLLQHQVLCISNQLLEKGLVTKEVHDWVLTVQGVSNQDKAARLVSCVTDQIKSSAQKYHTFIGILKQDPFFEEAVESLNRCTCC